MKINRPKLTSPSLCLCVSVVILAFFSVAALADGMLVITEPGPARIAAPFPLAVKYHHVDVAIKEKVARTSIDQEFFNPTGSRLEGTYIFPMPPGATISDFAMEIDGKMVPAELLDARKAREIYEGIVRQMRDPALLEYMGNGAFKVRIFPIEPHAGKKVKLSYSEVLKSDGGLTGYTYPLNTEKFSSAPLQDVSIRVSIESAADLKTVFCPTHEVEVKRKGAHGAVVGFEAKNVKPDQDFTLYYSADDKAVGVSVLCYRPAGEDGYFLLTATPDFEPKNQKVIPKDVGFVLDVSGSMAGEKIKQAKKAIQFCLSNLNAEDRFDVIRFSTEAESLFGRLAPASREEVEKAQKWVDDLKPIGGTNAEEALTLALKETSGGDGGRPKILIFITDGKPTIGITEEAPLIQKVQQANVQNLRIFTFGIGDDLNTHLLDKLTEATKAYRTYVGDREDMELKISSFYEKIKSPVLTDLKLKIGSPVKTMQTYPKDLPDLFAGSQLTVFGRYSGSGDAAITLEGRVQGNATPLVYEATFPAKSDANAFLAPLWAAQRIGYLLDQMRLHGEDKELVDEVTQLARRFGVITPYTSYLIVEDEKARVARNVMMPENQTLNAVPSTENLKRQAAADYDAMKTKGGAPSVTASKEVEALKNAQNYSQMAQGSARMEYKDASGTVQNLSQQSRNIQGRAFYQVGNSWVDSQAARAKNQKAQRIQFGSPAYWDLLKNEPQAGQVLALGKNVRFALNDQVYEVYE